MNGGMEGLHALAIYNLVVDILERRVLVRVNRDGVEGAMKHDPIYDRSQREGHINGGDGVNTGASNVGC